jgi:hypothetical protein
LPEFPEPVALIFVYKFLLVTVAPIGEDRLTGVFIPFPPKILLAPYAAGVNINPAASGRRVNNLEPRGEVCF